MQEQDRPAVPSHLGRREACDMCGVALLFLVGSAVLGCSQSTGSSAAPIDGASDQNTAGTVAEVEAGLASPDGAPLGGVDAADLGQEKALVWLDVGTEAASLGEVGSELRAVDTTVDVGDREAGPSSPSVDSAPDGVAAIACDQLASAYSAFVAAHRDCASVSDCKVVGGAGSCNCVPALGNGSGDAILTSAVSEAYAYLGRVQTCIQQGFKLPAICDAAPAANLRCEAGKCKADESSCLVFRG